MNYQPTPDDIREIEEARHDSEAGSLQSDVLFIDDAKLLEAALRRRNELRERCLRDLWEHFGIDVGSSIPGKG
ncbi:hypothetical protein [Armatimonas sp.]|uniref:hypothetical protein n=1 Tax=Armatimonas sp. TaxID=1872638 RepID=UPI00374D0413